jgi:hypothetical protein
MNRIQLLATTREAGINLPAVFLTDRSALIFHERLAFPPRGERFLAKGSGKLAFWRLDRVSSSRTGGGEDE